MAARGVDAAGWTVRFKDGDAVELETVTWASGYRVDHSWIDAPVFDEHGRLVHERGFASPRLYFFGLSWLHTRDSALIGLGRRRRSLPLRRKTQRIHLDTKNDEAARAA